MSTLARPRFGVGRDVRRGAERRISDRWAIEGVAIAHETGGPDFGQRHVLQLLDGSPNGIGARVKTPLTPGTTLVMGFASPGGGMTRGTVLRCLPDGRGYRVAVSLDGRAAA